MEEESGSGLGQSPIANTGKPDPGNKSVAVERSLRQDCGIRQRFRASSLIGLFSGESRWELLDQKRIYDYMKAVFTASKRLYPRHFSARSGEMAPQPETGMFFKKIIILYKKATAVTQIV